MSDTYTCAQCKRMLTKTVSEAVARAEYERNFPTVPWETRVIVCDDCFKILMFLHGRKQ